jgi:hypothetical protein
MKAARFLAALAGAMLLVGCLFERPLWTGNFVALPDSLAGVWVQTVDDGDPRQTEYAVFAPVDGDRWLLVHPAGPGGEAVYYEVRGRAPTNDVRLLQLRTIASFAKGMPAPDDKTYTAILLKQTSPTEIEVRLLDSNGKLKDKTSEEAVKLLESSETDSAGLFEAEAMKFRRLSNSQDGTR